MKKFQRLFSTQKLTSRSWTKIAFGSLTIGGVATAIAYFTSSESKPLRKPLRKLPDVDSLVSNQQISDIFSKLEIEKTPSVKSVARIDLNSVPSNNPGEDYHSENEFDKGLILGIYDGHGGKECADLISKILATYVADNLSKSKNELSEKENIKQAMKDAFLQLDHDIVQGCMSIQGQSSFWNPFRKPFDFNSIMKGLRIAAAGSCAIVAYLKDDDVYIASTGDCRAVLGRKMEYSKNGETTYQTIELSKDQTATNPIEFSRLCEEHPGEDETVVIRGRVLGGLMPSRAFGIKCCF
jgi:pyruvate dehydrogenase phosphatase